ncbi:magnesium-protoporphyrin IX monomethyl ester anaerobic oxidative cyclase [Asticcacaulis biprosthecium C19]|uniref:Magnesium-protoporphyrin IX monomethyl ester anaerobic oxidative cyclase n=1 Tax=Asticcacaulis biprosthecium C19 TaxID=715226 RepID=F4QIT9_9CAUL|nr:magnesium-protoporphyrin IX monomethyl ester anaerobic oxidative cyclase [Asticcacaulis biprosthecium]EGF91848.1 magnesium-protoporphyrin IX monomethyl ester anaerobic oxidative cyclase [Asticcacaulis biprosthecium C19]
MRILIVNPPHPAIGSRIPDDHLPPLGLLSNGGPLIDDGHDVTLLDAEFGPMPLDEICRNIAAHAPDLLLLGHSGSTSAHPIAGKIAAGAKARLPNLKVIYGGVFPTYHWQDILRDEPQFDYIVCGEGEETCRDLVRALASDTDLATVKGIAFRRDGTPHKTPSREMLADLDAWRIGWELIDFARYSYWGGKRAVVVQFSRGCPHPCNYCGQRGFWTQWRHRNPERFAAEIARLHRDHGVEVFNFADENPTSSKKMWKRFLEALIAEKVSVTLVGSTRADDIVRDRDHLHLYKQAGVERFLMGMENTDEAVLSKIRKGGSTTTDREAIRLMRQHGMLSMATWVVGFEEETDRDYWRQLRQLLAYDPDQIQSVYVTPHRWTPFFGLAKGREVIQTDQSKWDYKHQVLATRHVPPWRVFVWVKAIEVIMQTRPKALWRLLTFRDPKLRHAQRWYYQMGRRVWFHELFGFLFRDKRLKQGPSVEAFWGESLEAHEEALAKPVRMTRLISEGRRSAPQVPAQ